MTERLRQIVTHLAPVSKVADKGTLSGQVVIITGGAQGIGEATSRLFARNGATIVICDMDAAKSQQLVESLQQEGTRALSVAGNLMDPAFPNVLVEKVLQEFGEINCLINNAGFLNDRAIHKMTDPQFDSIMQIHNYAPFRLIRALSAHFMDPATINNPKCIINVSSSSGTHGQLGQINYVTAKAGVVGMTKAVAREWARYNVRCNAVAFGWMDTRMTRPPEPDQKIEVGGQVINVGVVASAKKFRDTTDIPLGRPGTAMEAAGCMLFLASELSSYVTGQVIEATGGRFM